MTWKVEHRKDCKQCGGEIKEPRFRTFCSTQCRNRANNKKYYKQNQLLQAKKRGQYSPNKKRCAICSRWYVQIGTHVVQKHGMTAREYKEAYNLPLKRGIVPHWYREEKGKQALENKTFLNLLKGKKFRYTKGDERTKIKKGEHGFKSNPGRKPDELYE